MSNKLYYPIQFILILTILLLVAYLAFTRITEGVSFVGGKNGGVFFQDLESNGTLDSAIYWKAGEKFVVKPGSPDWYIWAEIYQKAYAQLSNRLSESPQ